jgi:hypothetical protein
MRGNTTQVPKRVRWSFQYCYVERRERRSAISLAGERALLVAHVFECLGRRELAGHSCRMAIGDAGIPFTAVKIGEVWEVCWTIGYL